jgi:hypothetical protein
MGGNSKNRPACETCGKELPVRWATINLSNGEFYDGRTDVVLFCSKKCFMEAKE